MLKINLRGGTFIFGDNIKVGKDNVTLVVFYKDMVVGDNIHAENIINIEFVPSKKENGITK